MWWDRKKNSYRIYSKSLCVTFYLTCYYLRCCMSNIYQKGTPFFRWKFWIFYIAAGVALIVIIVMCCSRKATVKVPWNHLLLVLWTISVSYMVMTACAYYDKEIVITAIGLTIYACVTKTDFTYCGGMLSCQFLFLFCTEC